MNATLSEQLGYRYDIQPTPELKVTAQDCEPFIFYSNRCRHHDDYEEVCDGTNHYGIVTPVIHICDGAYESQGEPVIRYCDPCDGLCRLPIMDDDDSEIGCNRLAGNDYVYLINDYLANNQNGGTCHE